MDSNLATTPSMLDMFKEGLINLETFTEWRKLELEKTGKNLEDFDENPQMAITKLLYEDCKKGTMSLELYSQYIFMLLEKWIMHLIKTSKRVEMAAYSDFEDCMHDAYLQIRMKIDAYNPYMGSPTTFFTPYIQGGTKQDGSKAATKYYIAKAQKIDDACKALGFSGIEDPLIDGSAILNIALATEEAYVTVERTIASRQNSIVSLQKINESNIELSEDDVIGYARDSVNPEKIYLKKETKEALDSALDTLDPLQRYVLKEVVEGGKSYRKIHMALTRTGKIKEFENLYGKKIDQAVLKQIFYSARRKMANAPSIRRYEQERYKNLDELEISGMEDNEEDICNSFLESSGDDF